MGSKDGRAVLSQAGIDANKILEKMNYEESLRGKPEKLEIKTIPRKLR